MPPFFFEICPMVGTRVPLVFVKYTVVFSSKWASYVQCWRRGHVSLCARVCIVSASVTESHSVREMSAVGNRGEGWTGVLVLSLQLFGI